MLLAEELLLLLLDDEKGTASTGVFGRDEALAGALLLDLLEAGRLELSDEKLVATGSAPSEPPLAAAWEALQGEEPRKPKHWVSKLPRRIKPIMGTIAEPLVARGVLDEQRHKTLGVFRSTRYPALDRGPEEELRARLRRVLVGGAEPDAHTASLIALLVPLDRVKALVERDERKQAKARAKAVADRGPVGDAVRAAIEEQVATAVMAATVATTAGSAAGS
jgi:Golgi phosphoprotein 3 (GPP34)